DLPTQSRGLRGVIGELVTPDDANRRLVHRWFLSVLAERQRAIPNHVQPVLVAGRHWVTRKPLLLKLSHLNKTEDIRRTPVEA
ncbi:MAG: hypothetical protein QOE30_2267, partial [Mycobacterium sp.]|nr:hypothetical protein [Mycobacterium sp.]